MSKWLRNYLPNRSGTSFPPLAHEGVLFSTRCAPLRINDLLPDNHVLLLTPDYICINKPPGRPSLLLLLLLLLLTALLLPLLLLFPLLLLLLRRLLRLLLLHLLICLLVRL